MEEFSAYAWHTDSSSDEETILRIYGVNESGENVCVKVYNFTPYVYLELPDIPGVNWERYAINLGRAVDKLCGSFCPCVTKKLVRRKRLYFAYTTLPENSGQINENTEVDRRQFYYLFCSFASETHRKNFSWKFGRPITVSGIPEKVKIRVHEQNASARLQMCTLRHILTAGWIKFPGERRINPERQETICDAEYSVKWKQIIPSEKEHTPGLLVMSWDIEVYSSIPSAMPKSSRPADIVFQMSCILWRMGTPTTTAEKYILTLGEPCPQIMAAKNITVISFTSEAELLMGYARFVKEHRPNIILTYNGFGFDIEYMVERAKFRYVDAEFRSHGFYNAPAAVKEISWSSSAYQNQSFTFLDTEGILYIDLLPVIKRDYKLSRYSLNFVSEHFLGAHKDPLSPQGIFKCWDMWTQGHPKGSEALGVVSSYCIAEGTQVAMTHGTIPIEEMVRTDTQLLSWDSTDDTLKIRRQTDHINNGLRECIELTFEDGRTLVCTPNHQVATADGQWIPAEELVLGSRVKSGVILPETGYDTFSTVFARLLGYILTDGHLTNQRGCVYMGTVIDRDTIIADFRKISDKDITVRMGRNCWIVGIPASICRRFMAACCNSSSNRTNSTEVDLPTELLQWPVAELREFLGGLFGGDGSAPTLRGKRGCFTSIGFHQSRRKREVLVDYLKILKQALLRFNIDSTFSITSRKDLFIGHLVIPMDSTAHFMKKIGYRYCYHKTLRGSVASVYLDFRHTVHLEKQKLAETMIAITEAGISRRDAYEVALSDSQYPEYMPTFWGCKHWFKNGFKTNRPDCISRTFPKAREFAADFCTTDIFGWKAVENIHTYAISKTAETLPCFALKLISRRAVGPRQVYDITVQDTHSFLAEGVTVHNCVQDSVLVLELFQKLQIWVGLQEMANVCRVPVLDLYTRGQGIKTFSQIYYKSTHLGIVTEKDGYIAKTEEKFQGAFVFPPMAGIHEFVVPFDFKSLYPSGIIAMNICSSTFVDDTKEWGKKIPDALCHVIDWESHQYCGCPKDMYAGESRPTSARIWCNHFRYRFLKQTILKGILPDAVEKLLDARAKVRKVDIALRKKKIGIIKAVLAGKELDDKQLDFYEENFTEEYFDVPDTTLQKRIETLEKEIEVLDKRQLALKVSANSMYGGMGASKGYLSFLPGAMATTAYGRQSIELAKRVLREEYGGTVVYGDTDSCYVKFTRSAIESVINRAGLDRGKFDKLIEGYDSSNQENPLPNMLWGACLWLEREISKLYPRPMFLEFEGEIYRRILFLTKKRYMAIQCTSSGDIVMKKNLEGELEPKMTMKGVLLTRRDNSNFVRDVYGSSIRLMFDCVNFEGIIANILEWYELLCTRRISVDKFVVTQSVNELSEYKIRPLSTDEKKRRKRLAELELPYFECICGDTFACRGCEAYRYRCLPAQAQLAEKIRARGNIVAAGTRLPYVIIKTNYGIKAKKSQKIEDYDYFKRWSGVLRIDYLHYIENTVKQLDDALKVVFNKTDTLKSHYKLRVAKWKICQQISNAGAPPVQLISSEE